MKPIRGIDLLKSRTTAALMKSVAAEKGGEDKLQIDVVTYVRKMKAPGVVFWHTPNGGKRGPRSAVKFKAMGVLAGVVDLIFSKPDGQFVFLELKHPKYKIPNSKLTSEQHDFLTAMTLAGHVTSCLSDFDLIVAFLELHGLVRLNASSIKRAA
jgi:hypothetical protein